MDHRTHAPLSRRKPAGVKSHRRRLLLCRVLRWCQSEVLFERYRLSYPARRNPNLRRRLPPPRPRPAIVGRGHAGCAHAVGTRRTGHARALAERRRVDGPMCRHVGCLTGHDASGGCPARAESRAETHAARLVMSGGACRIRAPRPCPRRPGHPRVQHHEPWRLGRRRARRRPLPKSETHPARAPFGFRRGVSSALAKPYRGVKLDGRRCQQRSPPRLRSRSRSRRSDRAPAG